MPMLSRTEANKMQWKVMGLLKRRMGRLIEEYGAGSFWAVRSEKKRKMEESEKTTGTSRTTTENGLSKL